MKSEAAVIIDERRKAIFEIEQVAIAIHEQLKGLVATIKAQPVPLGSDVADLPSLEAIRRLARAVMCPGPVAVSPGMTGCLVGQDQESDPEGATRVQEEIGIMWPPKGKEENDGSWRRFAQLNFSCLLKDATAMEIDRPDIARTMGNVTFRCPGPVAIIRLAMKPDPQNPYEPTRKANE